MLTKTIKHNDLDGNPTETVAYFNLTKAEALILNIRNDLEAIGKSRDNNQIMDTFTRIMQASYGKRTGNGEFVKEGFAAFSASEAYSELFMELFMSANYATEFIKGILPKDISFDEQEQGSKSSIPEHLRSHPSMQSHLQKQSQPPVVVSEQAVSSPAQTQVEKNDYQEFLAFKAMREGTTPSGTGVSNPEEPQQDGPRADLI